MKFLFDFLPILLFFVAYKLYDIYVATGVIIVVSLTQTTWLWLRHGRIDRMPLIATALVVLLGTATLISHDETFIKWKPTVINWLFGLAFLGSQFIGKKTIMERMLGHTMELPRSIWVKVSSAWALFFFAMGTINLFVAYNFDTAVWVDFKLFGMLGLTLAFVIGQAFYLARHLKTDTEPKE